MSIWSLYKILCSKFQIVKILDYVNNKLTFIYHFSKNNKTKQHLDYLNEKRVLFFKFIMSNYIYNLLKKHYILRCLVLITFLSITLFLFTSTVDIINYKMYVCIIIISIYVLSLLVKQFEQNPQIEYLNLVLLYLNLLMFILFFFEDIDYVIVEISKIITKLWK